ncbi:WS/DGAT domain-containing protein [Allokutzneria oryzae]|uniref:WS/DGAT domain-containing protein n=1 Tax=Allokutzneria oryzae TaxID=1378989 RepID=A0ABV6A0G7_9PSEU
MSADMGAGHDATGRALRAALLRLWPGVAVSWTDVLHEMGPGVGPLFRGIYELSVRRLPGVYDFFYRQLWRHRWFALAAKRVIGSWSGRRLAGVIERIGPDLIISTYPMGSSGLEWLRAHRGLPVPIGAWVSDFAPHPSWVHAGLDLNLVMHEVAVAPAVAAVPGAVVAVSAPPVPQRFRPGDRAAARRRLNLPLTGPVALVSCGSLGFGRAGGSVIELVTGVPEAVVVVVAGHNEVLRRELEARFACDQRVRVLGWTDDMAELMTAADVVVTNAGGATALEALASGRFVLMHEPIAGHGRANAELMARAGLARVCAEPGELASAFQRLGTDPAAVRECERAVLRHLDAHRLEDGLRRLADSPPPHPLPATDTLFVHVDSETTGQHVGTAVVFDVGPPPSRQQVAEFLAGVPGATGTLHRDPRDTWSLSAGVHDPGQLVDVVGGTGEVNLTAAMDEFFSEPLDPARQLSAARLITGLPGGRTALLVKLHHVLGDGVIALQALLSATDGAAGRAWSARPRPPVPGRRARRRPMRVLRGLWLLARAGRAPLTPFDSPSPTSGRHHALMRLPAGQLRSVGRALGLTPGELLPALFAESLRRVVRPVAGSRFRLMVPWSLRGTSTLRLAGNRTGAVPVDLPLDEMETATRAGLVADALRARVRAGVPQAAHAVVRALGALPSRVRATAIRGMYHGRWFNGLGTVLPGPRREVRWHGTRLAEVYPVLALAPGTGLAWGAMMWDDSVLLCLTTTTELAPLAERLAEGIRSAFAHLAEDTGGAP